MKNFSILVFVFFLSGFMGSCEKEPATVLYSTMGVFIVSNDSNYVLTDEEKLLYITNSSSETDKLDSGDRVFVYFSLKEEEISATADYSIELISVDKLLTKPVLLITDEISDSLGNDPIRIEKIDIALNFLNINFQFFGNNAVHYINLVRTDCNFTDTLNLEILHNENNDQRVQLYSSYISFDLNSLHLPAADSVVLKLRARDYDDSVMEKILIYKY